jgi:hypothetical protein
MENTPTIRTLYPELNDDDSRQAEDNLEQYLLLVLRIYERITSDPASYAQFRTLLERNGTLSCTPPGSDKLKGGNLNVQP